MIMCELVERMKMESIILKIAGIFGETYSSMSEDQIAQLRLEVAGAMVGASFDSELLGQAYQIIDQI